MADIARINLSETWTGYHQKELPNIMAPEMRRRLIGGEFPDTGFSWEFVNYFKYEDGAWEPYDGFDEILPAVGFIIKAEAYDL